MRCIQPNPKLYETVIKKKHDSYPYYVVVVVRRWWWCEVLIQQIKKEKVFTAVRCKLWSDFTSSLTSSVQRKYSAEVVIRLRLLNPNDNTGVGVARGCWAQSITSLLNAPCEPFIQSYVKTLLFCSWVGFAWPRWRQSWKASQLRMKNICFLFSIN